jgi:hypothetical protein
MKSSHEIWNRGRSEILSGLHKVDQASIEI